ncbi:MAG: 4-hydroxythreonine-4-phosphate dehydrogenase PdxA [Pirellulales bacterium]|nr:4-hydroxythreonine-4-phosphate dehydrogenase PdxA [Pirellulales bacterium]
MQTPLLAITMGDPCGIGPETIIKACQASEMQPHFRPLIIGQAEILRRAARLVGADRPIVAVESPDQQLDDPAALPCLETENRGAVEAEPGRCDPRGGQAAYDAVVLAAELAQRRLVDGMVTAPLSKAALHAAGHHYPGHTELLADCCGVRDTAMMLYLEDISSPKRGTREGWGVVHATLHMALSEIFTRLTPDRILRCAELADTAIRRLKHHEDLQPPKIGVCALNPHAGEDGLFGKEEQAILAPAVAQAAQNGLEIEGPYPADTLIGRAHRGEFDALIAMYHDQGHIPLKLIGMHRAVNITLGLPIVRTSASHGTAFDQAWRGTADASGMQAAIRLATKLCHRHDPVSSGHHASCSTQ